MAISWTKYWQGSDDGTVLRGIDLRNIQDDIDANSGDATKIRGKNVVAPTSGDDGQALFWDNGNNQFDYKDVVDIDGTETIVGTKTFNVFKINEQVSAPSTAANEIAFYGKDVSGVTHPFFRLESSGTEIDLYTSLSRAQIFTSSGTFVAPAGVTKVYLYGCGAGGGGGGGPSAAPGYGGGGGGGAWVLGYPYTVVPGNSYTVTINAGGNGGAASGDNDGANGGTTVFDALTLTGGLGGKRGTVHTGGVGSGGLNGASVTAGTVFGAGGTGGTGTWTTAGGGGGATPFGAGGAGATGGDGASAAANTGAGGGGGADGGPGGSGGNGGSGIMIVRW